MKRAIFPGTFDPFTIGHYSVVRRALTFMDEVVIGIGINENKRTWFSTEKRIDMIRHLYKDEPRVKVEAYDDLTIDFAQRMDARFIVRGIRRHQPATLRHRDHPALHRTRTHERQLQRRARTAQLRQGRQPLPARRIDHLRTQPHIVHYVMMRKILTACLLLIAIGSQAQQPKDLNFTPARKLQIAEFAIQQLYVDKTNWSRAPSSRCCASSTRTPPTPTRKR